MFPLRKILFPVDFSEHCIGASRFVEVMTGSFEAKFVMLHVLELPEYYGFVETIEAAETRLALVIVGRSSENGLAGRLRANAYSIIRQSPCPVVSV
jgi:hypothetical protein